MALLMKSLLGLIFFNGSAVASYLQSPNPCQLVTTITTTTTRTTIRTIDSNICRVSSIVSSASTPTAYHYQVTNGVTSWVNGKPTGPVIYGTQPVTLGVSPVQTAPADQYVTVTVTAERSRQPKEHETKAHTIMSTLTKTKTITKLEASVHSASYVTTIRETVTKYQMTTVLVPHSPSGPPAYLTSGVDSGATHSTPSFIYPSYGPQSSRPTRTWTPTRKPYQPLMPTHTMPANHYTLGIPSYGGVPNSTPPAAMTYSLSASPSIRPVYSIQHSGTRSGPYQSPHSPHYPPSSQAKTQHPEGSTKSGQHTKKIRPSHKTRTGSEDAYETGPHPSHSSGNIGHGTQPAYPTREIHHPSHSSASASPYEVQKSSLIHPSSSAYNYVMPTEFSAPGYQQPESLQPTYQPPTSLPSAYATPGSNCSTSSLESSASSSASSYPSPVNQSKGHVPLSYEVSKQHPPLNSAKTPQPRPAYPTAPPQHQSSHKHHSSSLMTSCEDALQPTGYQRPGQDKTASPITTPYSTKANSPTYQSHPVYVTKGYGQGGK